MALILLEGLDNQVRISNEEHSRPSILIWMEVGVSNQRQICMPSTQVQWALMWSCARASPLLL